MNGEKKFVFGTGEMQTKNADGKAVKGSHAKRCSVVIIKDGEYEYDSKECDKAGFKGLCMPIPTRADCP